ncbi:Predicted O-methyltransferase YrrM [Humidesulfovibrio mexicanus]|uniref:Predicted O-methyltransferase YrrM n=1 Tax=Humidesulfovibrio mexicanus TaxID=147047 RepID=A0A238ZBE6_9BACT|nr:class I SAM-dependent methyltransferase [Humidesulfovibrio mexicanus]SNR80389.1 Predicted O-methyltransferase YrrM [Humidesulfovibrio mexicanus]
MFRDIPQSVEVTQGHMKALEAWRKAQGVEPQRLLPQVEPEAGKLLALLLANCPPGDAAELGTGAGYSALWLALACRATGRKLVTFEPDPAKVELARHCLDTAGVFDVVELRQEDGVAGLDSLSGLSFCFIDAGPECAREAFETALAALPRGGLVIVGEAVSGAERFPQFLLDVEVDPRVDAVTLPLGAGLLICRKVS